MANGECPANFTEPLKSHHDLSALAFTDLAMHYCYYLHPLQIQENDMFNIRK